MFKTENVWTGKAEGGINEEKIIEKLKDARRFGSAEENPTQCF